MLLFLGYYIIELKRENWAIEYLDIDNNKPDNSLKEIIKKEPKLDKKMDKLNLYYYHLLRTTMFFYFINVALMIRILYVDYHGSSTVSCFMSFVLLVLMKLYNSFIVARESVQNDKMMSAYMSEFVSYNVLDSDYVLEKYGGNKNNKLEDITNLECGQNQGDNSNEIDQKDESIKVEEIIPIISKV